MIAFVRQVSEAFGRCEPLRPTRRPLKVERARKQHDTYVGLLRELGFSVEYLAPADEQPSAVFVEDTAVMLSEVAVIARPRNQARVAEVELVAPILAQYGPVQRLGESGHVEGGDVLRIGRNLYVGLTPGTDEDGIAGLREIAEPFEYKVIPVETRGCAHLRAVCSFIPPHFLLLNPASVDASAFGSLSVIAVPENEPNAANALTLAGTTVVSASCPECERRLREAGVATRTVDLSELEKVDGRVTALSLILDPRRPHSPVRDVEIRPLQVPAVPAVSDHASQAVVHGGVVHISLLLPFEPSSIPRPLIAVEKQTELALQNLSTVLAAAGSSLARVVRLTIHLADVKDLSRIEQVYAQCFDGHRPARSVMQNRALPVGVLVAIEAVAAAPEN